MFFIFDSILWGFLLNCSKSVFTYPIEIMQTMILWNPLLELTIYNIRNFWDFIAICIRILIWFRSLFSKNVSALHGTIIIFNFSEIFKTLAFWLNIWILESF